MLWKGNELHFGAYVKHWSCTSTHHVQTPVKTSNNYTNGHGHNLQDSTHPLQCDLEVLPPIDVTCVALSKSVESLTPLSIRHSCVVKLHACQVLMNYCLYKKPPTFHRTSFNNHPIWTQCRFWMSIIQNRPESPSSFQYEERYDWVRWVWNLFSGHWDQGCNLGTGDYSSVLVESNCQSPLICPLYSLMNYTRGKITSFMWHSICKRGSMSTLWNLDGHKSWGSSPVLE